MKTFQVFTVIALVVYVAAAAGAATPKGLDGYNTLTRLNGDWKFAPASQQEGGATTKGPAKALLGTDAVAIRFRVIGKGSTVQENLLPGTGKEMATMYHCNDFKDCTMVRATHYCAKQNQPQLVVAPARSPNTVELACDMSTKLCSSMQGHVHKIRHELSDDNARLRTTYTIYKNGKFEKNSIYRFERIN